MIHAQKTLLKGWHLVIWFRGHVKYFNILGEKNREKTTVPGSDPCLLWEIKTKKVALRLWDTDKVSQSDKLCYFNICSMGICRLRGQKVQAFWVVKTCPVDTKTWNFSEVSGNQQGRGEMWNLQWHNNIFAAVRVNVFLTREFSYHFGHFCRDSNSF